MFGTPLLASRAIAAALVGLALAPLITGCGSSSLDARLPDPGPRLPAPQPVRIGLLPVEDLLPLWVAEEEGMFEKVGLEAELVLFETASQRDGAFASGAIDGMVTDMVSLAMLRDAGVPGRAVSVCLGAGPAQGRHGLLVRPGSDIRLVAQLENVPVATSVGTIEEYTLDRLVGRRPRTWTARRLVVESPAERARLLIEGKVRAALLPDPYFTLAARQGARVLVSDTIEDSTISQTVLAFSESFLSSPSGQSAVHRLLGIWDSGASAVNSRPASYRPTLARRLSLPSEFQTRYRVSRYPYHQLPEKRDVEAVTSWMLRSRLIAVAPAYESLVWKPSESF